MTLFAENATEVEYDSERDSIVKFYQTFTPPPVGKLQVLRAHTHASSHAHPISARVHTSSTFAAMLCARVLLQRAHAVILAQLAEAIAKAIVEDMAVLHKWYIYYNSKYAAPAAPACPRAAAHAALHVLPPPPQMALLFPQVTPPPHPSSLLLPITVALERACR